MIHLGDITQLNGATIPVVDVITGGSPCQDLSVAGKRVGLSGERSSLFMEQIRIVTEMREKDRKDGRTSQFIRPRFMVWENVTGAFSSNKGEDFKEVLTAITRIAQPKSPDVPMPSGGGWPKSGCLYDDLGTWSIAWRVHDAQYWGTPQRRKRIALVADFGGLAAPEILFERKGVSGNPDPSETERQNTAADPGSSSCRTISFVEREGSGHGGKGILIQDDLTGTINASCIPQVLCIGFKAGAGAKSGGIGWKKDQSPTLVATESGTNMVPCAAIFDARGNGNGKTVPTITGDHESRITDYTGIVMGLSSNHEAGIDVFPTLRSHESGGCTESVMISGSVRRLTPIECERLQGFPDGWTAIEEWVDTKRKYHKTTDTPRYRSLGNSIALPFWFWLLRRISALYPRRATLGSLFDGIGGFPLCWERCNGPGTAIWASEIDDFCIAVTKAHFQEMERNNENEVRQGRDLAPAAGPAAGRKTGNRLHDHRKGDQVPDRWDAT